MLAAADILAVGGRFAGIGATATGLELVFVLPAVARWRLPEKAATVRFVRGHQLLALALAMFGLTMVARPELCLSGGGLAAAVVVAYFIVAFQPVGDGADVMLTLVLAGLGAMGLMPRAGMAHWVALCVAANVCLAYWWSGVAKLRVPAWRTGRQVALAVNSIRYGAPKVAWRFLHHAWLARLTAW